MSNIGPRSVAAGICLVIATLLLPVGLVGFWGQRTLTDTQQFVSTVQPLANDPQVIDAIANTVTKALLKEIDLDSVIDKYVPEGFQPFAGSVTDAVPKLIYEVTVRILSTERFQQIWTNLAGDLQQATISALEGNSDGPVSEQNGQIVLDVGDVVDEVKSNLVDQGLAVVGDLPETNAADTQIVLMNAEQVDQAQQIYGFTKPIATFLIFIVVAVFAAAILFAKRRGRMVAFVGVGLIVGAAALRLGMAIAPGQLDSTFANTPLELSASVFFTTLTSALATSAVVVMILGVVLVAVGWFCSDQEQAKALRGRFQPRSL